MAIITSTVEYSDKDIVLEGFMAWDDQIETARPAILIAHPWAGRNEFVCEKAHQLAALGYVGFALDLYGKGVLGESKEECAALMQSFIDDRALLQRRMTLALGVLKQQPLVDNSQLAAIGYCFGGLCVLDLARSGADINGVVSFHGLLNPPDNTEGNKIKAKVLVLHGHDDPMAPVEQLNALELELTAAEADWQVHSYGQTMHAFTNPAANDPGFGTVYQAAADRRSWQSMLNFFDEVFSG